MDGMSLTWLIAIGLPVLVSHLVSIALTKAIQSYSRSLLEDRCSRPGVLIAPKTSNIRTTRPSRRRGTCRSDRLTLGRTRGRGGGAGAVSLRVLVVLVPVLVIGLLGYVIAGVIGKVFAEVIVDLLWPLRGLRLRVAVDVWPAASRAPGRVAFGTFGVLHRPAHLQLEIPVEDDAPDEDAEPDSLSARRSCSRRSLTRTDVGELMTPRSSIVSLPSTVSATEAAATLANRSFEDSHFRGKPRRYRRRALRQGFVPPDDRFPDVRRDLPTRTCSARTVRSRKQKRVRSPRRCGYRRHFVVVLDEYGSVAGVATLEDLLEELVRPIDDEHDIPSPADLVRELGRLCYDVDASLTLDELNDRLGLQLPTDGEFQTIGGLVFHELGRVPIKGDRVNAHGMAFTVREEARTQSGGCSSTWHLKVWELSVNRPDREVSRSAGRHGSHGKRPAAWTFRSLARLDDPVGLARFEVLSGRDCAEGQRTVSRSTVSADPTPISSRGSLADSMLTPPLRWR